MVSASELNVGVLLFGEVQLLDLSPIDLFCMCSKAYLKACELPSPLVDRGFDRVNVHYIAEGISNADAPRAGPGKFNAPAQTPLMPTTASLNFQLTTDITNPEVAPGKLNILLIPGPDPSTKSTPAMTEYLQAHSQSGLTDILVVCTGIFPVGYTGILDGKTVTGPRPLVDMKLRKLFPHAKWTDDRRWTADEAGHLWTAGGITNGLDMVAGYMRQKLSPELAELICTLANVGDRPVAYEQSKTGFGMAMGWIIVRALWARWTGRKSMIE